MEQLTFEAGKNMVLSLDGSRIDLGDYDTENRQKIVATTDEDLAKRLGVHHIQREWFVKKVHVKEMAKEIYPYDKAATKNDADTLAMFATIWQEGYNANKAEFTWDDMETMFKLGRSFKPPTIQGAFSSGGYYTFEEAIQKIRPLKLPQSITITSDFKQKIDTIWKD